MLRVDRIGKELGIDPAVILETSHGRRSIDTLALYDQGKANWDCQYKRCLLICTPRIAKL